MPELRQMSKQHGIPLLQGFLPDLALAHSAFNPYLFFPGRQCHGQTVTHPALRRASIYSADLKAERVPFLFARQTTILYPAQAVSPVNHPFPSAFIPGRAVRTVIIGATYAFSGCFLAVTGLVLPLQNIGRRACPLRFEVAFLANSSLTAGAAKSNWQEKTTCAALPTAFGCSIKSRQAVQTERNREEGKIKERVTQDQPPCHKTFFIMLHVHTIGRNWQRLPGNCRSPRLIHGYEHSRWTIMQRDRTSPHG